MLLAADFHAADAEQWRETPAVFVVEQAASDAGVAPAYDASGSQVPIPAWSASGLTAEGESLSMMSGSGPGGSSGGGGGGSSFSGEWNNNADTRSTGATRAAAPNGPGYSDLRSANLELNAGGSFCRTNDYAEDGISWDPNGGPQRASYNTNENPHPIVAVRHTLPVNQTVPSQITAQMTFGGVQGQKVYYDTAGLQPGDELRIVLQVDASSLSTGRYGWQIVVTSGTGTSATQDSYSGYQELFNRVDSEFGNRVWLKDLDRLIVYSNGVALMRGDGTAGWFREQTDGTYLTPAGSLTTLAKNYDGSYTLRFPDGARDEFDSAGLLTARTDRRGNETTYSYTDADGDAISDELAQIADPLGRITTYSYSGGLLQNVTDREGRTTTYQYNTSGFLTTVTEEDPDGTGPLGAPVTSFQHDADGRVTRMTDHIGRITDYTFNFAGRVESTTTDGDTWEISAKEIQGLVDLSVAGYDALNKASSSYLTASDAATYTDELNHQRTYELDAFGYTTAETDALGNQWLYERNANGQVTKATGPDPDDTGPLTAPVTSYQYDTAGNLTLVTHPDSSTESWTYETTFNQITSYTDELGRKTLRQIDSSTGDLLEVRRVVGQDDRSTTESDDVVTSYTYTGSTGSLPAGLLLSETDPLGRTANYAYYSNTTDPGFGRLKSKTYAAGTADEAVVSFEYDSAGNITAEIDPLGRRTEHEYDALGRRIATTSPDPDGTGPETSPVHTYTFCTCGSLDSETDALGRVISYDYDARGQLIKTTRPDHDGDGLATESLISYDAAGRVSNATDPLGRVTTYEYDVAGRLKKITSPDPDGTGPLTSPVSQRSYDALGRLQFETDPLGNVTEYQYDSRDRLVKKILPDPDGTGSLTSPEYIYQYDAAGQVLSETDPLGRVTSYEYDALGRLETLTLPDPDGSGPLAAPGHTYTYDKAGNRTSETNPLGNTTSYSFDSLDRLVTITRPDPDGSGPLAAPAVSYAYDAAGQMLSETDPLGRVTSYEYDDLGRLAKLTLPDPDGAGAGTSPFTLYEYDAVGNVTAEEDALGQRTTYTYNALDWRTGETDANSDTISYAFDAAGNRTSLTDPAGNTTSWVYDALDRPIEETNELLDTRYFAFDAAGNLTERTDRNGRTIEYSYDDLYRRTEERWLDSLSAVTRTVSYVYDAGNQLTSASDPAAAYSYTYDGLGRKTNITHDLAALTAVIGVGQAFSAAGNRTQVSATIGSNSDFVTDYTFDALQRMTRIEQKGVSGGNAVAEKRIDLAYNSASQFSSLIRYADLAGTQTAATSTYAYDDTGRLTDLTHAQGTTILADYGWAYDHGDRVTQFVSLSDGTVNYSYDARLQLTGADYDYQTDEAYTYNANGNRVTVGYSTGSDNRLLSDGTYDYEYDAEGNRTKRTSIATGETTEYQWDHRNRLVKITHLDSSGSPTQTLDYKYDIFDRRIGKSDTPAVGPAYTEDYVHDGAHLALKFEVGQLANRYVHGPVVDQILADEQVDSLTSPGEVLWPLTDSLGTVRDLAEYDSATAATTVVNHISFDAFGRITGVSNATIDHIFGYTGREWDAEADLQYNRARWYDPAVGRWLSQDPIEFAAGDANLYRYVGNAPVMRTDPTGLWWWDGDWIELGVGGVIGAQGDEVQAAAGQAIIDNPISNIGIGAGAGAIAGAGTGAAAGGIMGLPAGGVGAVPGAIIGGGAGLVGGAVVGAISGGLGGGDPIDAAVNGGVAGGIAGPFGAGAGVPRGIAGSGAAAGTITQIGKQAITTPGLPAGLWPALVIKGRVYVARFHITAKELAGGSCAGAETFYGYAQINAAGRIIRLADRLL